MWLFEKRGFVSVVAYDPAKDRNTKSQFRKIAKKSGTHLLVRARIEADLDFIKAVVPSLLVETDKAADYSFRAVVTRKQFKTVMAKSVDDIDYDSHFKEAARDASPKAQGRYSAMMDVWSIMAKLQPFSPYGGSSFSSGSLWGGKSSTTKAAPVSTTKAVPVGGGAKDMETFLDAYVKSGGEVTYHLGSGPRTGFKVDDRVTGYSGPGKVVQVGPSKSGGGAESVRVALDKGTTATFVSNFLMPENLPELPEDDGEDVPSGEYDMDYMHQFLLKFTKPGENPASLLDYPKDGQPGVSRLDDDAFELLTRVQEHIEDGEDFDADVLDVFYDEILWEFSSNKERLSIWSDLACVPAKYEQDAVKLFSEQA